MLQEEVREKYKGEDVEEGRLLHLPLPWYTHHSKIFFSRLLIILAFPKLPFYLRLSVSLVWNDNDGNLKVEEFRFWWSNPHYCDELKKGWGEAYFYARSWVLNWRFSTKNQIEKYQWVSDTWPWQWTYWWTYLTMTPLNSLHLALYKENN